ncbi:MAG: leucine-rich repeat domain-containing protein, partial [Cyanobacteria bacterium]|nr:leucine-rich repeat domain-containing protein [Cyanobacteriota bacterium]
MTSRPRDPLKGILTPGCLTVLSLFVLGFSSPNAVDQIQANEFTSFADWCEHRDHLDVDARHTVEVLLNHYAETEDCDRADAILSELTALDMYGAIVDVAPLSSLVNVTDLRLHNQNISDITPLATLTNLERLDLSYNQISDLTPLSNLTSLDFLNLEGNQI